MMIPAPPVGDRELLLDQLRHRVPAAVLAAVASVDRACFVPPAMRAHAWEDRPLPLGLGQTISQPSLVAGMAALLAPQPGDRVLDVGTGSGYAAAVLARLAGSVVTIERHPRLARRASANLRAAGIAGVETVVGDGCGGHPAAAPYDVIGVAATVDGPIPRELLEQLADGGRLLLPVREATEHLVLVCRDGERLVRSEHQRVRFVPFVRSP